MSALVLLASACSGGGASGGGAGGGVGPISPAPGPGGSPTPTPSPTQTNSSLADLQFSETFSSNATQAAARYDASGTGAGTASASGLTVSYDAASRSYTLVNGARSQTFAQSHVIQNSPTATVYRRTSGAVTDTLTMTRPGTAGSLTYQYVGGGFWERGTSNASGTAVDGSVDAFTYGVETPDAALARTGHAGFAVDLLGVLSSRSEGEPNAMRGTGSLIVDFASGRIDTNGRFDLSRPSTGASGYGGAWTGRGQLSSSNNLFAGDFTIASFQRMSGGFDGRFYGPAAQEVGAAFWARAANGDVAAGALLGRRSSSVQSGNVLAEISSDTAFVSRSAFASYQTGPSGVPRVNDRPLFTAGAGSTAWVDYNAAAASYTIRVQRIEVGGSASASYDSFTLGAADQLATQNDARFTLYRKVMADGSVAEIKLYRPVGANTELVLRYLSFASIETRSPVGGDGLTTVRNSYVPFGYATPQNQIPIVGTASYNGVLYGTGLEYPNGYGSSGTNTLYTLTGTARFEIDFSSNRGTMRLSPTGTDVATGATRSFGDFDFALSGLGSELRGSVGGGIVISDFNGQFFGPRAEEIGGAFSIRYQNPQATRWTELSGIAIGRQN